MTQQNNDIGSKKRDNINVSSENWEFDEDVAEVFTDMLERSIPDYHTMRKLVDQVAEHFIKPNTRFVDLGCANGLSAEGIIANHYKDVISYLSDVSEPMLSKCRERYKKQIEEGYVHVTRLDLTKYPIGYGCFSNGCSVILSCLTLQFIPVEYRQGIIESVYSSLDKGGAFILVEKVLGNSSEIGSIFTSIYYNMKRENQYTEEQIASKRKSLEGVLCPLTEEMNISMLKMAGFRKIDTFWKHLNFCGIIAIKD
jgi:tRNA (cmo5U34)-methyltransferase